MSNNVNNKNNKRTFSIKMKDDLGIKTQKACKQGWEANIEPKITSI